MENSTHNPTLREQLDAVRPNSDDLREPEVQEAARAIVTSDEWKQVFGRQQAIDRNLVTAMQNVDVPVDLRSRLQQALASDRQSPTETATLTPEAQLTRRSWHRQLLTATAIVLAAGLGWLAWPHGPTTLTLEDVRESLPFDKGTIDTNTLALFDGSFDAPLPSHMWNNWQLQDAQGLDLDGDGTHDAAIYEFAYKSTHGYLVVLPTSRLSDPPDRTFFSTASISYMPVSNVTWTAPADELVYICFVDRGQLGTLSRVLTPPAA